MLNLLTILTLEHRYIALIVSACIILIAVPLIILRYFKRTKVDENNLNIVYPLKADKTQENEKAPETNSEAKPQTDSEAKPQTDSEAKPQTDSEAKKADNE